MGDIAPDFNRAEFACKCGCGGNTVDAETLTVLQNLRYDLLQPVTINSGYRCKAHNKAVGGASNSQHLTGRAADIRVANMTPSKVADFLEKTYPTKYGIGRYRTFTHIDTRSGPPARWKGTNLE